MNDEKSTLYISGICPYCGAKLDYEQEERVICCPVCDRKFAAEGLLAPDLPRRAPVSFTATVEGGLPSVSSPENALAYYAQFCREYDWENTSALAEMTKLSLPQLERLAEGCKLAYPTDPKTYQLAYRTVTAAAWRALDALDTLSAKMIAQYNADDLISVYDIFEEYRAILSLVCRDKARVRKDAKLAIQCAEELGATNRDLYDMRLDLYELVKKFAPLHEVKELLDLPALKEAEEQKQKQIAEKLAASGVDAEDTYRDALKAQEEGLPLSLVLRKLMRIRGYKDSEERIRRLTSFFYFGNRYLEVGGKKYYTREQLSYNEVPTFSLYPIKDGVPEKYPCLTGISRIIATYGNYLFFLRDERYLCLYDTQNNSGKVSILDAGRTGDYICAEQGADVYLSSDEKTFYIRKKLPIRWKKTGCFSWFFSLFRRKFKGVRNKFNNYSLLAVNMEDLTCETVLDEVIDVMDFTDDNVFYTAMPEMFKYDVEFRVLNLKTGEDKQLLNSDCVIHKVTEERIIFSLCAPNLDNLNLYSMELASGETTLLERNIHKFFMLEGDRVFYIVSSGSESHLLSVKLDGTCRREILTDAKNILTVNGGFIYYVKGEGRNAALLKVDLSGENRTLLACRFASLIHVGSGYVYYFTNDNEIHSVLTTGKDDRTIARDVFPERIVAGRKNVFFYRIDASAGNDNAVSLYRLTPSTGVIRKIAYNVRDYKEFDANTIFFASAEQRLYRVPKMDPRDTRFYNNTKFLWFKFNREQFVEHETISAEVVRYCKYDKTTGEVEEVLTLGLPEDTGAELLPATGLYLRDKTAEGTVYTEARGELSEKDQSRAERRSQKRAAKAQKKYDRKKARADKRAARKKKRAIRKGRYPGRLRHSIYNDALPVSNLACRSDFGSPTLNEDFEGKV